MSYSQPASCEDFTTCKDALNSQRSASRAALGPTCDISFSLIFQLVEKNKSRQKPAGDNTNCCSKCSSPHSKKKKKLSPSMIDVSKSEGLWKTQNLGTFHWDQFLRFDLLEHLLAILHLFFSELSYHNYDTTFRQLLQGGSCSKAQSLALKSSPSCSSCSKDSLNAWHPVGCDGWWSVPGLVGLENPTPVTGPSKLAAVFGLLTIHDLGTTWDDMYWYVIYMRCW